MEPIAAVPRRWWSGPWALFSVAPLSTGKVMAREGQDRRRRHPTLPGLRRLERAVPCMRLLPGAARQGLRCRPSGIRNREGMTMPQRIVIYNHADSQEPGQPQAVLEEDGQVV